jgi:hypothetical protein
MSDKSLREKIAELGDVLLIPKGFDRQGPFLFERSLEQLIQGIEFEKGSSSKNNQFTANAFWRFDHNPLNYDFAMAYRERIGRFMTGYDEWFTFDPPETLDNTFLRLPKVLSETVLPFLDKHNSISAIVHEYETGGISASVAFGSDIGWRNFNLGFCYLSLGEKAKAAEHLKVVAELDVDKKKQTERYLRLLETGSETYARLLTEGSS